MSERKFVAMKCEKCGNISYNKRLVCLNCRGRDFTQVEIFGAGTVLTFTHLFAVPEGIERTPLTLGIVEFKNGIKVTGQIEDQNVKIGDTVHPVWGLLRKKGESEVYGFKFRVTMEGT
jgi:hypothetical protein